MAEIVKNFCSRLGIKYNDALVPYYKKGLALLNKKGLFVIDKKRLCCLNDKYKIFRKWFNSILDACDGIEKDDDLVLFIYILIVLIEERVSISNVLEMPDREDISTDFAPMFSLLYFLEDMISDYEGRGVPYDVISATLNGFDTEINDYYDMFGRPGMRIYVAWFLLFVRCEILRIGRFQFQMTTLNENIRVYEKGRDIKILMDGEYMHTNGMVFGSAKQTDDIGKYYADIYENGDEVTGYSANEYGECMPEKITLKGYREIMRKGDKVISVHIPSHAPLDVELSEKSYEMARQIFRKCYPEFDFKGFYCFSWMMDKRLKQIMGRDTNVTLFADKYLVFPTKDSGEDIYSFLFHLPKVVPACELPQKTSMQRAVKEYLMQGNIIYTKGGIFI